MRLYEIADEIERILAREVDHETGEITDATFAALERLEMERDRVALAVGAYLKGELAEADAIDREADKLRERGERHRRRGLKLMEYLEQHCEPGKKLSDRVCEISWRKSTAVVVDDETHIPRQYIREKITVAPDKKALRGDLQLGKEIEGARLEHRQNLVIR